MAQTTIDDLERILLSRDYLYDHPQEYREGVEQAFEAIKHHPQSRARAVRRRPVGPDRPPEANPPVPLRVD